MSSNCSQSFTSLYKVKSLDQIPTCILRFFTVLGPFFHQFAKLFQVITWRHSNSRCSVLVVLIWISLCLFTWQILALLPCLVIVSLVKDWFRVRTNKTRREQLERKRQLEKEKVSNKGNDDDDDDERMKQQRQQEEEEEELLISRKIIPDDQVLLDDTLQDITIINECIEQVIQQWRPLLNYIDGTNRAKSITVLSILMYAWPVWFILCWLFGTHHVFMLLGTFFLIRSSPQYQLVYTTMKKNRVIQYIMTSFWAYSVAFIISITAKRTKKSFIFSFWQRAKLEKSKAMTVIETSESIQQENKGTRSEMIFQFEVYENQRWWLGVNWTTNMMPSEREPWTDNQLKPISSKESFQLPETSLKTIEYEKEGQVFEKTINKMWSWADGDWWVDMTGEINGKVDHHGWEYGNNAWKQMSGTPGIQTFTRRRRWCRRAKLVERETITHLKQK